MVLMKGIKYLPLSRKMTWLLKSNLTNKLIMKKVQERAMAVNSILLKMILLAGGVGVDGG